MELCSDTSPAGQLLACLWEDRGHFANACDGCSAQTGHGYSPAAPYPLGAAPTCADGSDSMPPLLPPAAAVCGSVC